MKQMKHVFCFVLIDKIFFMATHKFKNYFEKNKNAIIAYLERINAYFI